MNDLISRQAAIEAIQARADMELAEVNHYYLMGFQEAAEAVESVPSAQPEPLTDAYMKAVWAWLLDYQIKVAELKGRYTPYEVLSWVANDWRKEHEGSD